MNKNKKVKTIKIGHIGGVQGDVPILRVAELSVGAKPTAQRIMAVGEVTGHNHQIVGNCQVYEAERKLAGQLFKGFEVVVADDPVTIEHTSGGEHYTIEMTPGVWFIPAPGQQQVEYDGRNERRVMD